MGEREEGGRKRREEGGLWVRLDILFNFFPSSPLSLPVKIFMASEIPSSPKVKSSRLEAKRPFSTMPNTL